jgi:hypothetical protein
VHWLVYYRYIIKMRGIKINYKIYSLTLFNWWLLLQIKIYFILLLPATCFGSIIQSHLQAKLYFRNILNYYIIWNSGLGRGDISRGRIGHILRRNCLLQQIIEGSIKGGIDVTGRRGRRRRKLPDEFKEGMGYTHLKEEALDRSVWRDGFGRDFWLFQGGSKN